MDSIDLFSVKSEITLSTNDLKVFIFHSFKYTHYFLSKNDPLPNTLAYFLWGKP